MMILETAKENERTRECALNAILGMRTRSVKKRNIAKFTSTARLYKK